ncbi:basic endochitinase-like isoform X1 [Syzygium oleosum]|uniref:basic endochitinase-like isoform X1 n=1 Tax=Syzygium oleosum TaxID=219896 RepID=UPI0024BAECAE|nr:basic endochitinase-like isoform X1 [Syzygium oleosum]XP_056176235.1 basic endochitinase-like isoform X1 [Syzygium oleosum]
MRFGSLIPLLLLASALVATAQQCGSQAGGVLCPDELCCSKYGYCGSTEEYCGDDCQSQCNPNASLPSTLTPTPSGSGRDIGSLISQDLFNEMLKHRNDGNCPGKGFYTYDAFITAAKSFGGFGTTGDTDTRKREIAAFLAQTSHKTTGGWASAPDGPYAWGYCFLQEQGNPGDYCVPNQKWPCAPGKKYYGRGPIQISYNYNYGRAGKAINYDLLSNPDAVATDPVISFKTALWFWMTPQSPKPSYHAVVTGQWQPSVADSAAGWVPGYGLITSIINGWIECRKGLNPQVDDWIGFYKRYCDLLKVGYGNNLDCYNKRPFA